MTTEAKTPNANTPAVKEVNITEQVLSRVRQHQQAGLRLPDDYSSENALKSAYLVLQEVKDRSGKPVLESCTKVSIANSLFEMVVRGLSPLKKQCYFIAYGDKLQLSPSYFGNIATARRVGLKNIVANVIYEKDEFVFSVGTTTGRKKVEKHVQALENIDIAKIKGAYAVIEMADGTADLEVMTMIQIKQAWLQGAAKGNSGAHQNFSDEMARKSVINRACKRIINSSDDSYLMEGEEPEVNESATADANGQVIDITDTQEQSKPEPQQESKPEPRKKQDPKPEPEQAPEQAELVMDGGSDEAKPGF